MATAPTKPWTSEDAHRPVCAGHRGFKAKYPENTLSAFKGAIDAGATIIETDIQVSGDGVVVVSHDPSSLRCFGVHHAITSTPYYGVLDKLETADKFKERMPTFKELAELFASSSDYTNVQLMLDVKRTNEPWVVSKVVEVLKEVNPDMTGFWAKRMALGIWREDVLAAAEKDAPELPIVFIGVSLRLARKFMHHKQVAGLSVHHASLNLPGGESLIKDARANGKLIYSWTVNSPAAMKWAVSANIDGIVTDHPDVYTRFIDGLTQKEIDTIYSASAPHSFFSWKELWVKFPLIYALAAFYFTLATLSNFILPQRKKI